MIDSGIGSDSRVHTRSLRRSVSTTGAGSDTPTIVGHASPAQAGALDAVERERPGALLLLAEDAESVTHDGIVREPDDIVNHLS